ncbi:hypothetical protein Trydic_g18000 [Trypoxylus dichotomus]
MLLVAAVTSWRRDDGAFQLLAFLDVYLPLLYIPLVPAKEGMLPDEGGPSPFNEQQGRRKVRCGNAGGELKGKKCGQEFPSSLPR